MEKKKESYQLIDEVRNHLNNVVNSLRLSDRLDIVIERGKIATRLIDDLLQYENVDPKEIEDRRKDVTDLVVKRIQIILIHKVKSLLALQSKAPTNRGKIFLLDRLIAELEQSRDEVEVIIPDHNINDIIHKIREVRHSLQTMNE